MALCSSLGWQYRWVLEKYLFGPSWQLKLQRQVSCYYSDGRVFPPDVSYVTSDAFSLLCIFTVNLHGEERFSSWAHLFGVLKCFLCLDGCIWESVLSAFCVKWSYSCVLTRSDLYGVTLTFPPVPHLCSSCLFSLSSCSASLTSPDLFYWDPLWAFDIFHFRPFRQVFLQ